MKELKIIIVIIITESFVLAYFINLIGMTEMQEAEHGKRKARSELISLFGFECHIVYCIKILFWVIDVK